MLVAIERDFNILHLNLVFAFLLMPLVRLLTNLLNILLEVFYDLSVFLLTEDVVLQLGTFDFLKPLFLLPSIFELSVVDLIQIFPVFLLNLNS